jgi:hypothetical protein
VRRAKSALFWRTFSLFAIPKNSTGAKTINAFAPSCDALYNGAAIYLK